MTATPPPAPPGHGLLAGRTVLLGPRPPAPASASPPPPALGGGGHGGAQRPRTSGLSEAADRWSDFGPAPLAVPCDVTDEARCSRCAAAVERHGTLDVVVCNAGLGGTAEVAEMTDDQWAKVLDVTLTGTFRCNRAAVRHLYAAGSGVIMNNASVLRLARPGRPEQLRGGQGGGHGPHPLSGG